MIDFFEDLASLKPTQMGSSAFFAERVLFD